MFLTKREEEVIRLLAQDRLQKDVADALRITTQTVKAHLLHARGKNKYRTTIGLVVAVLQQGTGWQASGLGEGHL